MYSNFKSFNCSRHIGADIRRRQHFCQGLKYCAVIYNMCSDNLRLCSDKGLFVQLQEQDYATTYKLTRIAPFYSNMQKEQTTAEHSCVFLVF